MAQCSQQSCWESARKYEHDAAGTAELHAKRHHWAARATLIGGATLGLRLLPGVFKPSLLVFGLLWLVNGAGQAL